MFQKNSEAILNLYITQTGKEFKIIEFDPQSNTLKLKTKALPQGGKANLEIEKNLKKILKTQVQIIKGLKSKEKLVKIHDLTQEELSSKILPLLS